MNPKKKKLFDYVIGNPPYNEDFANSGNNGNFAKPVYHLFMDFAYEIASKVELIHPARFLFNAGSTGKKWNEKMLSDKHFKVLEYEADGTKVFPNTDIKGGIAISYRDADSDFGAIGTFIVFKELRSIAKKVRNSKFLSFADVVYPRDLYHLNEKFYEENTWAKGRQSQGHEYDVGTKVFDLFPELFTEEKPQDNDDYALIFGRINQTRGIRYVKKKYLKGPDNFEYYKVFVPKSNGSGALGEVLSTPLIGEPLIGHAVTFLSIGKFETRAEAEACMKYVKTKFARVLLGIKKVTQDNPRDTWEYVPLQDFTEKSDIDWTQTVAEIDRRLYAKYGLDEEEIRFIETRVKEMK